MITAQHVAAACREAINDGTLLAVMAERYPSTARDCLYLSENGLGKCAIGVALDATTLRRLADGGNMSVRVKALAVIDDGIVCIDPNDLDVLDLLQRAHDEWLSSGSAAAKARFLDLLHSIDGRA